MGIFGLKPLIAKYAPTAVRCSGFTLKDLSGTSVAIDTSIYMYKYLFSEVFGPGVSDLERITISICEDALFFMTKGITPVYVFDGKPPDNKAYTLSKRVNTREKYYQEISQLSDENQISSDADTVHKNNLRILALQKRSKRITPEIRDTLKKALDTMCIPNIKANGEAEVLCAYLNRCGAVSACISNDTDLIVLGAPLLVLPFSRSKPMVTSYKYTDVLAGMGVTSEQFRDICILCGCDYLPDSSCKIKNFGPVRAYSSILKHNDIEGVLANLEPEYIPKEYRTYVAEARANFSDRVIKGEYTSAELSAARACVKSKGHVNVTDVRNILKTVTGNTRKITKIIETIEYLHPRTRPVPVPISIPAIPVSIARGILPEKQRPTEKPKPKRKVSIVQETEKIVRIHDQKTLDKVEKKLSKKQANKTASKKLSKKGNAKKGSKK